MLNIIPTKVDKKANWLSQGLHKKLVGFKIPSMSRKTDAFDLAPLNL